ncbi:hypothetical protein CWB72_09355 [Pseudoalteromonas phenolica]|nr:hypothetical protein CWB72_09355 [Pseudoalteromonas phenolica]
MIRLILTAVLLVLSFKSYSQTIATECDYCVSNSSFSSKALHSSASGRGYVNDIVYVFNFTSENIKNTK